MKYFVSTSKDNFKYLSNSKINNINKNDNNITFETNEKSLKKLLNDISDLSYYNKRKIKIFCFIKKYLISIIGLIILSIFMINEQFVIKKIDFVNENTYDENVINYFYSNKLNKKFMYYYLNDSLVNINSEIKQKFYYYEWISVNKKGNILQIIIDKQDEKSYLDESSNIVGDIVANKSGIVRYYFIKKGVNLVKDNQSVESGDVLVSGNLLINNNLVDYIHPIGIILAEVVEIENIVVNKVEVNYVRTGKILVNESFSLFNLQKKQKCNFECYEEEVDVLFDNKIVKKTKTIYYEIKEVKNIYNENDAKQYAYSQIEKNFNEKRVHDKERIIESFLLDVSEDNDKYYFKFMIKKIINISEFKPVNLEDK